MSKPMTNQIVACPHCGWPVMVSEQRVGTKRRRLKTKRTKMVSGVQAFETTAAPMAWGRKPFDGFGKSFAQAAPAIEQGAMAPGESRSSTLYHQWSLADICTSLALAGVSGALAGLVSVPVCIALKTKWHWPPIIWLGATAIVWGLKAKDFFDNDKAVVSSQEQERVQEPAPMVQDPPSAEIIIQSENGKAQTRARLRAPRTNHAGLWQYAQALVSGAAEPSYEGGRHVQGARSYGYSSREFDGRSDAWRPTAIAAGLLEQDPHKSKGYRLTRAGKRAFARVAEHRLGEWG